MAVATNLGTGGAVLDAQFGSSAAPNTNEPLLLPHGGTNYLYLPGVALNYASTPDAAALDITGDIEIVVRVALDDWTPAAQNTLLSKRLSTLSVTDSYEFSVQASGVLRFIWSDGVANNLKESTIAPTVVDGAELWVRATLDVDNGASGSDLQFFTSSDGIAWNQLGATVTTAGVSAIAATANDLRIGIRGTASSPAAGKFYRAIVRNGIGGTTVFDADFTTGITSGAQTTFVESSSNAATVTINRSTAGRKSVAVVRPVWLLGTDDFFEVADNDLLDPGASDSFSVVAVYRHWNNFGTNDALVAKKADTTAATQGWLLGSDGTTAAVARAQVGDGSNSASPVSASRTAGTLTLSALVLDRAAATATTYRGGTAGTPISTTSVGSLANSEVMRIGRLSGAGTEYADMECLAVAVFRRALTAGEIATIAAYYGAV